MKESLLFSRYIDPKTDVEDRMWLDYSFRLKAFAGKEASFMFKTTGGSRGDTTYDWAGWSMPRLILDGAEGGHDFR